MMVEMVVHGTASSITGSSVTRAGGGGGSVEIMVELMQEVQVVSWWWRNWCRYWCRTAVRYNQEQQIQVVEEVVVKNSC
jgi:hypothetical protein